MGSNITFQRVLMNLGICRRKVYTYDLQWVPPIDVVPRREKNTYNDGVRSRSISVLELFVPQNIQKYAICGKRGDIGSTNNDTAIAVTFHITYTTHPWIRRKSRPRHPMPFLLAGKSTSRCKLSNTWLVVFTLKVPWLEVNCSPRITNL